MIGIKHVEFYFPSKKLKKDEIKAVESNIEEDAEHKNFIETCGVESVNEANDMNSAELSILASLNLFKKQTVSREEIDLFIYISPRAPTHLMSSEMTLIVNKLDVRNAFAFSIGDLGCVNISAALLLAKKLVKSGIYSNALITCGSKPFSVSRLHYPVTVIGDAGMALLVSKSDRNIIVDEILECDGQYWDLFSVDYRSFPQEQWRAICKNINEYSFRLAIDSRNKFRKQLEEILNKNGLKRSSINHFFMQNISKSAFEFYEESLNINFSSFCKNNLSNYGHLGSIDVMLNYFGAVEAGACGDGETVLVMNNSPVAAWCTMLIQR